MRRAGLCFVPLKVEELIRLVGKASVVDGMLIETAELKAVRENLQLARMSNGLQWPKEHVWLDNLILAFLEAIKAQWHDGMDEEIARARSKWLLEQFEIRQWSHRFATEKQPDIGSDRYRGQVLSLAVLNTNVAPQTRQKYWRWFEDTILDPIRDEHRDLFTAIVQRVRTIISEASEQSRKDGNDAR